MSITGGDKCAHTSVPGGVSCGRVGGGQSPSRSGASGTSHLRACLRSKILTAGRPPRCRVVRTWVDAVVRSTLPIAAAHCGERRKTEVGEVNKFSRCSLHAYACAYQHVRRRGISLVGGTNGGDVGDDLPQFPFVGPGSALPPSRLPGACLLFLLCGHQVPPSSEGEDPSLSPTGWFRCLFRCLSPAGWFRSLFRSMFFFLFFYQKGQFISAKGHTGPSSM